MRAVKCKYGTSARAVAQGVRPSRSSKTKATNSTNSRKLPPSSTAATSRRSSLFGALLLSLPLGLGSWVQEAQAQEALPPPRDGLEVATFAGGCFWCMEPPFDKTEGVLETTSGYTGGEEPSPSYRQVSAGVTGHAESLQVLYDPKKVSYEELLQVYWHQIDPTVKNRQFCDSGKQYRSAIFYHNEAQKEAAIASFERYRDSDVFKTRKLYTEIKPAKAFWPAEDYHQDYYKKKPILYKYYRFNCGRDQYLQSIWGDAVPPPKDPYKEELRK
ncbi:peptide methionine sulfoxide reductase MsrA [Chloropicon primus]|uniref:peptide-methionine (S)-S-oxide reductase n=1 Tax=Chloropicon primus TaxID=1764295 RepID=A0A5B8MUI0_9CHLO|nr:peptide methionine sulfoxide reductase MsrA [Chloropicon primus]UPR02616.1 peptide methionine sulfoxide reductase MsrA [Chloropicon primus]|eukprot:QDZ23404.1 peptide methionine sulfoxide reductase MsrA [Chloropicon primus]